jgi:hypothetical protein
VKWVEEGVQGKMFTSPEMATPAISHAPPAITVVAVLGCDRVETLASIAGKIPIAAEVRLAAAALKIMERY